MRKHKWAIIAGVCAVVLLALAGLIVVPKLINRPHPHTVSEGHVILMPGHWWKAEMTEEQFSTLRAVWGQGISVAQLLQELWPDVLQQMPQQAITGYEKQEVGWPTATLEGPGTYEEWKGQMFCSLRATPGGEGPVVSCIYIGTHESEEMTFEIAGDRGFTEDRTYRVSIYTGQSMGTSDSK